MSPVLGHFYDGRTSSRREACLEFGQDTLTVRACDTGRSFASADAEGKDSVPATAPVLTQASIQFVEISTRLGNSPRYLDFPDGSRFETEANDAIDGLERHGYSSGHPTWAAWLESRLHYALVSVVVLIVSVWLTFAYGVPWLSKQIAFAMPDRVIASLSGQVIAMLDNDLLEPSEMELAEQEKLRALFMSYLTGPNGSEGSGQIQVIFRKGGDFIGANAFALPGGVILFTDEIVDLARHQDELVAVLLHEHGHVVHRHALRSAIQSSTIAVLIAVATGDVSSLSSIVIYIPVLLTELGYSRHFEEEADLFARDKMLKLGIPLHRFPDILTRLELQLCMDGHDHDKDESECSGLDSSALKYLSTHPSTKERGRMFASPGKE